MKYKFTGETRVVLGVTYKQIQRLFDNVVGWWIEKENE